ncbi:MAG: glycosyltransferase [Candidatus Gastranaerophilales bacterium]|nr:glycosyltransferase [Candidatus Gastranaerophilales bacterium]
MPLLSRKIKLKNSKFLGLKKKIYFSISSEGFGHSSRILAMAREFNYDELLIGSYNYAFERIKKAGYPCIELQQELKLVGEKGVFDVGKTIFKNHSWALTFNQLVKQEMEIIKESGASCVVADGRLVPVMAADKLSLPCIVITNQSAFYPFFAKDSALVRVFGKSFDWIMKTWLSSAEEIIIPDFPPPYTICLPNLSHNFKVMKRTRFVGPLVSWDRDEITPVERTEKPYIVVTLGGHSYRKPLFDTIIEVARQLPDIDFDIFTFFETNNIPKNVKLMGMTPNLAQYMKAADLVITQAGHSTAMELLTLGKPSIIVPDLRQIEQENNASRMSELEVAKIIRYDELSIKTLSDAVKFMLNNSSFAQNAEKFAIMASKIKGRKKAAEVLCDYASRLHHY